MFKVILIIIAVLLIGVIGLSCALYIQYKFFDKKLSKREEEIKEQLNTYNKKAETILNENKAKKESLHTGDVKTDFENSLKYLNGLKK